MLGAFVLFGFRVVCSDFDSACLLSVSVGFAVGRFSHFSGSPSAGFVLLCVCVLSLPVLFLSYLSRFIAPHREFASLTKKAYT